MNKLLVLIVTQIAVAFAGLPLPPDLQDTWGFLMKEDPPSLGRVVGGTVATSGQRPYQIILRRNGALSCGGSLIGTKTVLTAAHCVAGNENNPNSFTVQCNTLKASSGGQTIQVTKIVRHAQYNSQTINYDYAILHLGSAFTPGTNAAVGQLVADGQDPASNDEVVVSGFGRTTGGGSLSDSLLVASLNVVDRTTCSSRWGRTIAAQGICAHSTSKSACNGDSGGPLTCGTKICGVVSWGSSSCLHQTLPNVYARVGAVISWINSNSNG